MIKRLIWTIWTPMSSVLKKADKLNLSLSLSFKKMHLKMSSGKWQPFCLGLNVLRISITFLISVLRNDNKDKYVFMYQEINLLWQGFLQSELTKIYDVICIHVNSLTPGRYISYSQPHIKDRYLDHSPLNCPQVNATRPHWWSVKIGSGNVDQGIGRHMASLGQNELSFTSILISRNK